MVRYAGAINSSQLLLSLIMIDKIINNLHGRISVYCIFFIVVLFSFPINADNITDEQKIKAALLLKLTQFIDWPESSKNSSSGYFKICVLGQNEFDSALTLLNGKKSNELTVETEQFNNSQSVINNCQLVFISESKRPFLTSILNKLNRAPVLTISDSKQFAEKGGMIQLVTKDKHISFKINLKKVEASGLKISSTLLQLSTIVDSDINNQ